MAFSTQSPLPELWIERAHNRYMYFKDFQHLVRDERVIDGARNNLLKSKDSDSTTMTNWWRPTGLAVEVMEKKNVNEIIRVHLEDEFIPQWMGPAVDYSSVALSFLTLT